MTNSDLQLLSIPLIAAAAVSVAAWIGASFAVRRSKKTVRAADVLDIDVAEEDILQTPQGTFFRAGTVEKAIVRGYRGFGTFVEVGHPQLQFHIGTHGTIEPGDQPIAPTGPSRPVNRGQSSKPKL